MAEVWYWAGVVTPWIILAVCSLVGLVGTLLPAVPGGALILLGAWIFAFWTGFQRMAMEPPEPWLLGWPTLTMVTLLAIVGGVGQYFVSGLGARKFGASNWGVAGALVGFVVGLMFTPVGALIGAFVGAAAVEYLIKVRRRARAEEIGEPTESAEPADEILGDPADGGELLPEPAPGDEVGLPAGSSRWSKVGGALKREGRDAGKASLAGFGAVLGAVASFVFEFVFGLMMILVIVLGLLI